MLIKVIKYLQVDCCDRARCHRRDQQRSGKRIKKTKQIISFSFRIFAYGYCTKEVENEMGGLGEGGGGDGRAGLNDRTLGAGSLICDCNQNSRIVHC